MALVIGLHVGSVVFVGDSELVLIKIVDKDSFVIKYDGVSTRISSTIKKYVAQDIAISAGVCSKNLAKAIFFAPASIKINRASA